MKRLAFNFLAALSLVLCIAMTAEWIRSYYRVDHAFAARANGTFAALSSANGSIIVETGRGWPEDADRWIAETYDPRIWVFLQRPSLMFHQGDQITRWSIPGLFFQSGTAYSMIRDDGTAAAESESGYFRLDPALPCKLISIKSYYFVIALGIVPLWRVVFRRLRTRAGLPESSMPRTGST